MIRSLLAATVAVAPIAAQAQMQGFFCPGGTVAITSVNADGWSAIPTSTTLTACNPSCGPDTGSPITVAVTRNGYDTAGNTKSYTENVTLVQRVRQAYPNGTSYDSTGRTALSNYITSADTISGATNNSTLAPPTDIAAFITTDHQVIGNSVTLEFLAYSIFAHDQTHPIPYASCTATDGTTTTSPTAATFVPSFVDSQVVADDAYDLSKLSGYRVTINTTSLSNNAAITVNCKAYPWVGGSSQILDSSTGTVGPGGVGPTRGWYPQIYYKDTTHAATPLVEYVSATGSDSTGDGSSGNPFATIYKALNTLGVTGTNGGRVRIQNTTGSALNYTMGTGTVTSLGAQNAEVVIEADPAATGAITVVLPSTTQALNSKYTRLRNLTIQRTGSAAFFENTTSSTTAGTMVLENIIFDNNSISNLRLTNNVHRIALIGGYTKNLPATNAILWQPTSNAPIYPIRGTTIYGPGTNPGSLSAPGTPGQIDGYIVASSVLYAMYQSVITATLNYNGSVITNVLHYQGSGNNNAIGFGDTTTTTISGIAVVNNLFEWIGGGTTPGPNGGWSRDPAILTSLNNVVIWNNTNAGVFNAGRWNTFYDNNNSVNCQTTTGSPSYCGIRNHTLISFVGNEISQLNNKSDYYIAISASDTTDAPFHFGTADGTIVGNTAFDYGVGSRDNVYGYSDANGTGGSPNQYPFNSANDFSQDYGGLNLSYPASGTKATRTDLWTAPAVTTYNGTTYTAGTGVGTYTPCVSVSGACTGISPAYQHFKGVSLLPYTLGGTARSSMADNAGAF